MAVAEVTDDGDYWIWRGLVKVPKNWDPSTGVFMAFGPPGGTANIPALVKGDPGLPPVLRDINLTELAYADITSASATYTLITPGSETVQPVYDLALSLHAGAPGSSATVTSASVLGAASASPTAGYLVAAKADLSGVELVPRKVGGQYWPASIGSTATGAGDLRTLATIAVPAQPFAWRPRVFGQCRFTGTGADVLVDLIARLNDAASGDEVGRAFGQAMAAPPTAALVSGPPAGSATGYGQVAAGAAATLYLRAEKQSGANDYSTASATSRFMVEVAPLP